MTMTTDERTKIRRALGQYVDEAPAAPEWQEWESSAAARTWARSRRGGLTVAVAAAIIVFATVGGGVVFRGDTREAASSPVQRTRGGDISLAVGISMGDWYEALVADASENGPDNSILQGAQGPEPDFDTSGLGEEQILESVSQEGIREAWSDFARDEIGASLALGDQWMTELSPLVLGGRVGSSFVGVVGGPFHSDAADHPSSEDHLIVDGICQVRFLADSIRVSGVGCSDGTGPLAYGRTVLESFSDLPDSILLAVPPEASVVALETAGVRLWQRPRGGLALFVGEFSDGDPDDGDLFDGLIAYTIYSASGEAIFVGSQPFGE